MLRIILIVVYRKRSRPRSQRQLSNPFSVLQSLPIMRCAPRVFVLRGEASTFHCSKRAEETVCRGFLGPTRAPSGFRSRNRRDTMGIPRNTSRNDCRRQFCNDRRNAVRHEPRSLRARIWSRGRITQRSLEQLVLLALSHIS